MRKTYRFCPFCAAELASGRVAGRRLKACPQCGFVDYANARPTAGAVIINERGEVLLARRAGPPMKGSWNLPGGFLESDEHPQDGVVREVREETGLELTSPQFIGIRMDTYNDPHQGFFHTLNTYYAFRVCNPTVVAADDASELRFFPPEALPRMAFACDLWAIEEYGQGRRQKAERAPGRRTGEAS